MPVEWRKTTRKSLGMLEIQKDQEKREKKRKRDEDSERSKKWEEVGK